MEVRPHVHELKLCRGLFDDGPWEIRYGDTTVRVCAGWRTPTKGLVERAIKTAIRKHDEGSAKAGEEAARMKELTNYLKKVSQLDPNRWASEQMEVKE